MENKKSISNSIKKISLVMPVYNSEKSIKESIESVILQTYSNWELVIVDDGSVDNSANICDSYSNQDQRIKVCHIRNEGVSHARNYGISIASGDLLCFLDSDDRLVPQALSIIIDNFKENDLLIFGYIEMPTQKKHSLNKTLTFDSIDNFAKSYQALDSSHLLNVPWNKCFRTARLKENKIYFPEDLSMGEDLLFNLQYLEKCNSIKVVHHVLYEYNVSSLGSLSKKIRQDTITIQRRLKESVDSTFKHNPDVEDITAKTFVAHIVNDILNLASHDGYRYHEKIQLINTWLDDDYFYEMFLRHIGESNQNRLILYFISRKYGQALVVLLSIRRMFSRLYHCARKIYVSRNKNSCH